MIALIFTSTSIMDLLKGGLVLLLAVAIVASTVLSIYLLILALASLRQPARLVAQGASATRFAILIPAHEEELVIGQLLESINRLDYPRELLEVHVIADHCSDQTVS